MYITVQVKRDNSGVYETGYNKLIPTDVQILGMVDVEDACTGEKQTLLRISHPSFQGWLGIDESADDLMDRINTALCCDESGGLPQLPTPEPLTMVAGDGSITLQFVGISNPPPGVVYQAQLSTNNWVTVAGTGSRATPPITIGGLVNGVPHIGRIRSTAPGYSPSDWANYSSAVTPVVLPTPAPPTNFIVNDTANTADWTINANFPGLPDYEFTMDYGNTVVVANAKPMLVGAGAHPAFSVGVRVKGVAGVRHPSAWLWNPQPYTAGLVLVGYALMRDTNSIPTLSEILAGMQFPISTGSDYAVQFTNTTPKYLMVFEPDTEPLKVKNGAGIGADMFGNNGLFPTGSVAVAPFRGYIAKFKTIAPGDPLDFNQ